jgi:ribosomal peptide maturation radical SAM protein 1
VIYANRLWFERLTGRWGGSRLKRVLRAVRNLWFLGLGDWVFSQAAGIAHSGASFESPLWANVKKRMGSSLDDLAGIVDLARTFLDDLICEIADAGCNVVGLTTTFDQTMASVSLMTMIKRRAPETITVLGGANCVDGQGAGLHRGYSCIDVVVRGEGEAALPDLLTALACRRKAEQDSLLAHISGLCWRDSDGVIRENSPRLGLVPWADVPIPDFSDFFDDGHALESHVHVQMEASRGCWWGEKHHCTFCGLNGEMMTFRAKPPMRVLREIEAVVTRHGVVDIGFTDAIMDLSYLRTLMPALAQKHWDVALFWEVKSGLSFQQLETMAEAGVAQIQPGVESLVTATLKLMRKGVSAWQNIRLLRDCATVGIMVNWTMLYGFPGESWPDYQSLMKAIPDLVHLAPPMPTVRIVLTRSSPYFTDSTLGLVNIGPEQTLKEIYGLDDEILAEVVGAFRSQPAGLAKEQAEVLLAAVELWQTRHRGSALVGVRENEAIRIVDQRVPGAQREYLLTDPVAVTAYEGLLKGRNMKALDQFVSRRIRTWDHARLPDLVEFWLKAGLVFADADYYVALVTNLEWGETS